MYISKSFIPILKNNPSEAKIKSHKLMLRVGMIKQSSAGIYSWLPLGFKVMKKIEQVVREEQNKIGAQEILMPNITRLDSWHKYFLSTNFVLLFSNYLFNFFHHFKTQW